MPRLVFSAALKQHLNQIQQPQKSFNHDKYKTETTLSKYSWDNNMNNTPNITLKILKYCKTYELGQNSCDRKVPHNQTHQQTKPHKQKDRHWELLCAFTKTYLQKFNNVDHSGQYVGGVNKPHYCPTSYASIHNTVQ